jgi:hypothetical protein
MTNDDGRKPEGAPERSPKAGVGAPSGVGEGMVPGSNKGMNRKQSLFQLFVITIREDAPPVSCSIFPASPIQAQGYRRFLRVPGIAFLLG